MESGRFPEIPCALCCEAIDLNTDLCADENGKAVHDHCYVKHMAGSKPVGMWRTLRLRWQQSKFGLEGVREQ
jgi:hypothetical protein